MIATTFARAFLVIEELEQRQLLSMILSQLIDSYGFNQIKFGSTKGDGTGQTIAIIGAYDATNIASDLTVFDAKFGLANKDGQGKPALTVAYANGTAPTYDLAWAQEETLDVEWAHAIAPGAHILLVEAASNGYADLLNAVDYARNQTGVTVVSMSWGSGEFAGETAFDAHFLTPAGHTETDGLPAGVAFVASSGDVGAVTEYPASSPNVLAVGGTSLQVTYNAKTKVYSYGSEIAWTGSGGGISPYESKPAFQAGVTQSKTQRTTPDVAFDADPYTGVYMYFTNSCGQSLWYSYGGTSIGAPQWAALIAIADQGRAYYGLGSLNSTQLLTGIYKLPESDFHDVTKGVATSCGQACPASCGYDLATGRGTPITANVVRDLLRVSCTGVLGATPKPLTVAERAAIAIKANLMPGAASPVDDGATHRESANMNWPSVDVATTNFASLFAVPVDSWAPSVATIANPEQALPTTPLSVDFSATGWLLEGSDSQRSLDLAFARFPDPYATMDDMLFG